VSDAGTPGLSDPGAKLVSAAREEGIKIIPIPGPSAVTAILSVAGFSTSSFSFHGFFPRKKGERQGFLARLARLGGVHIFFESPERFSSAIAEIAAFRPELQLVIGRELTKKFEEVEAGKAEALSLAWKDREPRGEFVIACEFPAAEEEAKLPTESEVRVLLQELKSAGVGQKLLTRTGVALGLSRRDAYNQGLQSRENSND
jgi:16S rRNA (cytidine1402-2'-O)-methyltransferase